jgi:hypothetical protein
MVCQFGYFKLAKLLLEIKPTIQIIPKAVPFADYLFEDVRIRLLTYYVSMWHNDSNTEKMDKYKLSELYFWLVGKKPSLEEVFKSDYCDYVMYCLKNFGAEEGDYMGAADIQDIEICLQDMYDSEKL